MDYKRQVQLDVNPAGKPPVVRIKQGDGYSRFLQAQLMKDGANWTPGSGIEYLFRCQKPDGHAVLEDSIAQDATLHRYLVINQGSGVIQIELIDQVSTAPGVCRCDLCLIRDEKVISTIPFILEVVASPDVATLAVSSDDFRTLSNLIAAIEDREEGITETVATLTLPSSSWTGSSSPYTQTVTVTGYSVSAKTKVDLHGTPTVISTMKTQGTDEIMVINNSGVLTAYAIGSKPTSNLSVQASLYEVRTPS